jgi:hypothetical protein
MEPKDPKERPSNQFKPGNTASANHRWQKGVSANPGGYSKTKLELRIKAREGLDLALDRALQILKDDDAEWEAWVACGKFVGPYGYGIPKAEKDTEDQRSRELSPLSIDERRALARIKMSNEVPDVAPDADDPASDEPH